MNSRTARSNALLLRFAFICVRIVCISVPIELILEPDYLRTLLRLVADWDSSVLRGPVQEREGAWGSCEESEETLNMRRVRANEGSSLVSDNLDRRVSTDRAGRAVNLQFDHVFAA